MVSKNQLSQAVRQAKDERIMYRLGNPGKIETGEFKRPDHNDFATAEELRERKFSGQRFNGINRDWELWVMGRKVHVIAEGVYSKSPEAIPLAYAEYFEMDPDLVRVES